MFCIVWSGSPLFAKAYLSQYLGLLQYSRKIYVVGIHWNCFKEVLSVSTQKIWFYGEMRKKYILAIRLFSLIMKHIKDCHNIFSIALLTLKMPRKPASENVRLCHVLNILANFSNLFLHTGKQCGPWEEQSDLGPHCCKKWLLKSQADNKADDNCCAWQFKVNENPQHMFEWRNKKTYNTFWLNKAPYLELWTIWQL